MKLLSRRHWLLLLLVVSFAALNAVAFFHAWRFTHFANEPGLHSPNPEQLSPGQKLMLLLTGTSGAFFVLTYGGALVGFVLALVNTFKKKPSPALVLAYAFFEGLFVGGISGFYNTAFDGIVPQAVFGTLGVFAVTLLLFMSGKVRATPKATRFFIIAMVGYMAFTLVNLVLMWTGVTQSAFGLMGVTLFGIPLGVLIGIFVVVMAAYSLILDFDQIKTGVERGAPRVYAWTAAFGLIVTLVWLYLEILRILAIVASSSRN